MFGLVCWLKIIYLDQSAGELMTAVIAEQFARLRDADRYWYTRVLKKKDRQEIENTKLSDIIKRNTQISNIQSNVFFI